MLRANRNEIMSASSIMESTARRDRSIHLAVVTSFVSKAGSILLQLLSIPIAIRVLGRAEFGLYTTVSLALTSMALLEVGIGPALTHGLARARAAGDELKQRELGSTAFFLMLGISMLAGIGLATVMLVVPVADLFGSSFTSSESTLRPALWVGLGLFLLLVVLNLTERIREGHLEVASNNLWGAAGNVMAATSVGVGIWFIPQVWFLVIAVHGSMVVARLCNTVNMWKVHPLMVPSWKFVSQATARRLFGDGFAFSTCCLVPAIVEYNLCGWLVGYTKGPSAVALYGVFISLTIMQLGFVVMLSTPTWPAVAEALSRDDHPWARKAAKRLYLYGIGFALCSAAGLVLLGPWVLPVWLGKDFTGINRMMLACYGLYFIAHVWRHLNHAMMIGTGQVSKLVGIQLFESVVVAAVAWIALRAGGTGAMLAGMGMVILALTGTFLPRWVLRALRSQPVEADSSNQPLRMNLDPMQHSLAKEDADDGPLPSGEPMPARSMSGYFWNELDDHADNIALVTDDDVTVNFLELARMADEFAARLPVGRQLVALQACNSLEAVAAYLGCLRHRHPVILLSPESLEDGRIVTTYQPNFLFKYEDGDWKLDHLCPEPAVFTEELAVMLSTSGTTGAPKLVKLSHENIDSNARAIVGYLGLGPDERAISTLNFYYSYGMAVLNSHLSVGARVVITRDSLVSDGFWDLFRASGATSLALVPYQFEFLDRLEFKDMELPSLRYITQAGGRLAADKIETYARLLNERGSKLFVMYGQTEASPRISYIPPDELLENMDAIGRPVPGGEIILLDNEGVEITAADVIGELVYRGPNVMLGYALSREDLGAARSITELRTGDIALRKSNGIFKIVGRMSRFIKLYGLRINLDDLEVSLAGSGHKVYSSGTDELVVLFHVNPVDESAIISALHEKYHIQNSDMVFRQLPEIPLMSTGKVDYRKLREISESIEIEDVGVKLEMIEAFREFVGGRKVTRSDSFLSLGGDSLSFLSMSLFLEKKLGYVPVNWEHLTVAEMEALTPSTSRYMKVPVETVLRVVAIVFVMASHVYIKASSEKGEQFLHYVGGANVLMILAGLSMARYYGEKLKKSSSIHLATSMLARILIVYYLVTFSYFAVKWNSEGIYFPRWILLTANLHDFSTQLYPYWFISVYVHIVLAVIVFWRIPLVRRLLEGREQYFGYGLLALGFLTAEWMKLHHPTPAMFLCNTLSQIHLFALGWCIYHAKDTWTKIGLLVLASTAAMVFWMNIPVGHHERPLFIIGSMIMLLCVNGVNMPRKMGKAFVWLAAISFYLYIVHILPGYYAQFLPTDGSVLESGLVEAGVILLSVVMAAIIARLMPRIERKVRSSAEFAVATVASLMTYIS